MNRDAEYRAKALECAEAAEQVQDLQERIQLLEMAQGYLRLAEHVRSQTGEGSSPMHAGLSEQGQPVIAHDAER